jgi:adsorption protein B
VIWKPPAPLDHAVLAVLVPLSAAILVSSLDDLLVDIAWAWAWLRARFRPRAGLFPPGRRQLESAPRRRIAILLPLWREDGVIASMLEHNLAAIRYPCYDIFAGCYPNDLETRASVGSVAARGSQVHSRVHVALCPHDGPTSKADCLNWIYQHMRLYEEERGVSFDVVITHDAEDLIHPDELLWINYYAARFDFIQTPVLPLPSPLWAITHGVYCDEFAEYHSRDMTVRAALGGFVPSAGVGTAYRRSALESLARTASNRIFEPGSLTEDYENGLRLFRMGCTQAFVPITRCSGGKRDFMATREYFPNSWPSALRQRTRWVTGIALQGWQHFGWMRKGWSGKLGEIYWLWRDRKGLLTIPLSMIANAVFLYGLAAQLWTRVSPAAARLAMFTMGLQVLRTGVRMGCVARIYGAVFALGVPVRALWANTLNSAATVQALARFVTACALGRPLAWLKTDHSYPTRASLTGQRRRLGEILVSLGYLEQRELRQALEGMPEGVRLGEYLAGTGRLTEDHVYDGLSLQQGLPVEQIEPHEVPDAVARALPEHAARQWRVLPFRVADGELFVAGPEAPSAAMTVALRDFTSLRLRFHLVTPSRFESLAEALL